MFAIAGMISGLEGSADIKKPTSSATLRFFKGFYHDFQKLGESIKAAKNEEKIIIHSLITSIKMINEFKFEFSS